MSSFYNLIWDDCNPQIPSQRDALRIRLADLDFLQILMGHYTMFLQIFQFFFTNLMIAQKNLNFFANVGDL